MKSTDSNPTPPESNAGLLPELRKKAQEIAPKRRDCSPEYSEVIPAEEARQKLHELLVHQIELEMQNDELRRAQTELEDARARYLDLYDLAPVSYCTISEKGLILETNLTAANLLDVARGALINQPISRFIFKEDQDVYYLHKRELFETGKPQAYELKMRKRDGTVFWAHLASITLSDADGVPICRVALSDITERKLRDEELKAIKDSLSAEVAALNNLHAISTQFIRQDNLQSIYHEILKAAIVMSHADKGSIQVLDKEKGSLKLLIHSGFEKPYLEHFDSVTLTQNAYWQALKQNKRIITEDVLSNSVFMGTPDMQIVLAEQIVSVQSTTMVSSAGNLLGVISTHYKTKHQFNERELRMFDLLARQAADVIERARMEKALQQSEQRALALVEELQKADQNKNDFISMLSHELRNPLAVIMAGVSLLELTDDSQKTRSTKEIMKRQSAQLCRLVDDLLDLTRINMNKIKLKSQRVELCKLVAEVVDDYKGQFEEKGIRLETDITPDPLFLDADAARLTQVIGNLLHNAVKFTKTGGAAILSVYKQEEQAVICVKDNGIGLNTEILLDVFQPFVQLDNSIDRSNGGLGLGLAIVKGMVELHGGSVSAFSEGVGKGTQFTVLLPISYGEENDQGQKHSTGTPSRLFRILCIEDNTDFAEILCSMLEQFGHKAISARNGLDGIAKAKEFTPDVIFCDIGLPGINGYEVAKRIRSDPALAGVYMIGLTGYAGSKDIELAVNAGFNKHMSKPVDMNALNQVLAEVE